MVALLDRLDVVDDQVELAVGQDGVDATKSLGRLRAREERHDHPDGQGPAKAEAASGRARPEPELLHYREDAVASLWIDDVLAVQSP